MVHFLAEIVPSADRQTEVIQGYSVALLDTACDVTSGVTECVSSICLWCTNQAAGQCFKQAGGECSLWCDAMLERSKGATGHGHSGNTTPWHLYSLWPSLHIPHSPHTCSHPTGEPELYLKSSVKEGVTAILGDLSWYYFTNSSVNILPCHLNTYCKTLNVHFWECMHNLKYILIHNALASILPLPPVFCYICSVCTWSFSSSTIYTAWWLVIQIFMANMVWIPLSFGSIFKV